MIKLYHTFPACSGDYHGFVSPNYMMREIDEGVAAANFADGAGFSHIFPTIGVTWMLGQCVLEFKELLGPAYEVEIEALEREQHGIATVRRCVMRREGREIMRYSAKLLPVDFKARKAVPASALDPFWKTPAAPSGEKIPFLQMPENMETKEQYAVKHRDCDTNKHMTAFRYLDLIMETVGYWDREAYLPERIQVDYLRECLPGEALLLQYGKADDVHYCRGLKEDGSPAFHASVRFAKEAYPIVPLDEIGNI